jgi:hypothetical protein
VAFLLSERDEMPAITQLTNIPSIDDPDNFAAEADDLISNQLPTLIDEINVVAAGLSLISTTDTSASSVAIGTGAKTFTVSVGKSFSGGMFLMIADTAAPSTNWMYGQVTSYSGTSLVMNITAIGGSGTKTAWTVSQSATGILGGGAVAGLASNTFTGDQTLSSGAAVEESVSTVASATTPDIWSATSNNINYTGAVLATGFATAPQAGVNRTLILAGAASFTAGANMLIDGIPSGTTIVLGAGDRVKVRAISTTQFRLEISQAGGVTSKIQPITASVAANALTVTLNPTALDFRSATLGSGTVNQRSINTALSLVISSGSTLGTTSAVKSRLAVLAIDNAGTIELAVCNAGGGVVLDESTLITTTAEGGAGAADSATVIYSTTARVGVPFRIVGYIESTQATAGTWATAPSLIQGACSQATNLASLGFAGYYESPQQTITAAGPLTLAHGLGRKPISIETILICTVAEGGYSIGNEVPTPIHQDDGAAQRGCAIDPDTANLNLRYSNNANVYIIPNKTTGARFAITLASWRLIIRAWG